ncbi:MAG: class I SAM-dependent methyltransferase [Gemmatimonadaceae bacterium]
MSDWNRLEYAESRYREREPWEYSERGVERLRHAWIAELAQSFHAKRTLDLGCSLGQLTGRLAELPTHLFAADLSPTAVTRARENLQSTRVSVVEFVAARSVALPFKSGSFDLIIASDGLYSWDIERDERAVALVEIHRVMSTAGVAIFTDHMRRNRFAEFVSEIETSALRVVSVSFLYDRLAYQFESWFRGVRRSRISKAVLRSTNVAMILSQIGRLFGSRGSRHVCVIARKE